MPAIAEAPRQSIIRCAAYKFLSQSLGIHAAFPYENLCVA